MMMDGFGKHQSSPLWRNSTASHDWTVGPSLYMYKQFDVVATPFAAQEVVVRLYYCLLSVPVEGLAL